MNAYELIEKATQIIRDGYGKCEIYAGNSGPITAFDYLFIYLDDIRSNDSKENK